jgi:hypothetical protein
MFSMKVILDVGPVTQKTPPKAGLGQAGIVEVG